MADRRAAYDVLRRGYNSAVVFVVLLALSVLPLPRAQSSSVSAAEALRARLENSPRLPFRALSFVVQPPTPEWQAGSVSSFVIARDGSLYEIQRGAKTDPILHVSPNGKLLASWGKGDFQIPHSIRLDSDGNIWTVDAGSSTIIEWSPSCRKLKTIVVGEQPENGSSFRGASDVAFGPDGRVYITDGYGNARVLVYDARGRRVKQWGQHGALPGQFDLPHAIQISADGTVYVADRENNRIEKFDLEGRYLGEIAHLGRVYSIKLRAGILWASMGPPDQPPGASGGWVVKLNAKTGELLGHIDVPEGGAGHDIDVTTAGEPVITRSNGLLWFRAE